jgi:hypothetical protein
MPAGLKRDSIILPAFSSTLLMPVQPRNSTFQCLFLAYLTPRVLPFHMPCPIPTLPTPPSAYSRLSSPTNLLCDSVTPWRSSLSGLFSDSNELFFPPARRTLGGQALCFDSHPHCPGVLSQDLPPLCLGLSVANPFFSCDCGLFGVSKKVICLGIMNFRTLLQKHPGWGVSQSKRRQRPALLAEPRAVAAFQCQNHYLPEAALC